MSNVNLKCHPLITSITINGVVKVPDGNNTIVVPSADVTNLFRNATMPQQYGPLIVLNGPTDPTT